MEAVVISSGSRESSIVDKESWSCWLTGMSKSVEILVAHPRSSDFLVNRFVEFLSALPEQSLHRKTFEAIPTAGTYRMSLVVAIIKYAVRAHAHAYIFVMCNIEGIVTMHNNSS